MRLLAFTMIMVSEDKLLNAYSKSSIYAKTTLQAIATATIGTTPRRAGQGMEAVCRLQGGIVADSPVPALCVGIQPG
jgi:hypothetical protein